MTKLQIVEAFLRLFGADKFVFQTFTDSPKQKEESALKQIKKGVKEDDVIDVLKAKPKGSIRTLYPRLLKLNAKGAGIYFQVNGGKDRQKKNITSIRAFFLDVDVPLFWDEVLKRIRLYMPPPSIIIQSSKGKYQVYWLVVDCPLDKFSDIQYDLAIRFGSDPAMKNLDRVMRVPTFDHCKDPSNRQEVKIIEMTGNHYTVDQIIGDVINQPISKTCAVPPKPPKERIKKPKQRNPFGIDFYEAEYEEPKMLGKGERTSGLVRLIGSLIGRREFAKEKDESLEIRSYIKKYNSVSCEPPLSETELTTEVFPCVERHINNRIAASKKEEMVVPQPPIDSFKAPPPPKDHNVPKALADWLHRYVFVSEGSLVADMEYVGKWQFMTMNDFKNLTENRWSQADEKKKMIIKWLQSPTRLTARGCDYLPNGNRMFPTDGGVMINTYVPPKIPIVSEVSAKRIEPFIRHINYMFPEAADRKTFLDWFACTVQKPQVKIQWSPILYSEAQGVGKSWFFYLFQRLLGEENCKVIDAEKLRTLQYDDFKINSTLCWVHEIHTENKYSTTEKLKSCITETQGDVNIKWGMKGQAKFYANYGFCTNHKDAIVIEEKDRRWWVHEIIARPAPIEHYEGDADSVGIWGFLDDPVAMAHMKKWCMEYDLSSFKIGKAPPMTSAKEEMQSLSKHHFDKAILECISHKTGVFACDIMTLKMIFDYIELEFEIKMTPKIQTHIRNIWLRISTGLPNNTSYVCTVGGKSRDRKRVRSIRHNEFWKSQDSAALSHEYTRAVQTAAGNQEVLKPMFRIVKK